MPHMTVLWRAKQLQFRGEAWKDSGTRPAQPCTSCHPRACPRNLRVCSWCPSSREKRSSLLVFSLTARTMDCLPEHVLFFGAGIRVRSIASAPVDRCFPFLLRFWTGNTATAWHFGTVIGNQNLLRLSRPPSTPASESFLVQFPTEHTTQLHGLFPEHAHA